LYSFILKTSLVLQALHKQQNSSPQQSFQSSHLDKNYIMQKSGKFKGNRFSITIGVYGKLISFANVRPIEPLFLPLN
jgi:hypothetical protein